MRLSRTFASLPVPANAEKYERLANDLALHAQTEEELLYPAAILVGDIIRARLRST